MKTSSTSLILRRKYLCENEKMTFFRKRERTKLFNVIKPVRIGLRCFSQTPFKPSVGSTKIQEVSYPAC